MDRKDPKLRTVNKSVPPFKLNCFPNNFAYLVGEQLVYILATRGESDIEGKEWERIFSVAIGAEWKPSNVGFDDVVLGNTAWGAKSVLAKKPSKTSSIRLISGRNDLINSFDYDVQPGEFPDTHGEMVLRIYNERVSSIREHYKHVRTIVLIRTKSLLENVVYEVDTVRYDPELFYWKWKGKNLYGYKRSDHKQKFTWQSGGQQFTIFENVSSAKTIIKIKQPQIIPKEFVLQKIGFDKSWITVETLV